MAAYAVKARWLFDEASTGQAPVSAADDTGNANTLTIDYSGSDANWTSVAAGNGLDFVATVNTAATAIAELADLSVNGTLGADLKNQTEISIRMVIDLRAGHANGMRVQALGTNSGNGDLGIVADDFGQITLRWDQEAGGSNSSAFFAGPAGAGIVCTDVVIATGLGTANDRIKMYVDGSQLTRAGGTAPPLNDVLANTDSSDRSFSIGNRPSLNRNPEIAVYYAEIGTGVLSPAQIADYTILLSNNDADWQATGLTISPTLVASEEAVYQSTVTVGLAIAPTLVSSEEAVYQAGLTLSTQVISPSLVTSEEQVYNPSLLVGVGTIFLTLVTSEEFVYQITITGGIPGGGVIRTKFRRFPWQTFNKLL